MKSANKKISAVAYYLILIQFFALAMYQCTLTPTKKYGIAHNSVELEELIANAQPGDTVLLANGVWTDLELIIRGKGNRDSLITIKAQEKGKVFLEGNSYVRMGGEYIHLEGLVFRNGFTPVSSVISTQADKNTPCNNCRITECVIDNFNPSERFDTDYWIELYGKNNRVDHNYIVGKRNRGVTMAVRLSNERDRENNHMIDYNYFGYRPTLGSNGGETLRIGTSHHSLSNSNTTVENNFFEHCNGELEIISSKSCQNIFRNNIFYECQGSLTMRHGNETMVENNYFFGNRQPNTGGIRIINESQTVRNNYCEGLTGYRFRGALVIMNGVPNSPLNRYFQVINSIASNNLFLNCDYIQLCAGSDEERSAVPENTTFVDNVFINSEKDHVFTIYDDVSGIDFQGNLLGENLAYPSNQNRPITRGFDKKQIVLEEDNGIKRAANYPDVGPVSPETRPGPDNTGVSWYPKKDYQISFNNGETVEIEPGENTLYAAIKASSPGDKIVLSAGDYHQTRSINILHPLSIVAHEDAHITFNRSPLFGLENGGSLSLEGLHISGKEADDYSGNSVIRTSRYSMIDNYKLAVKQCRITDLDVNHSFNFLKVYKNTFADSISLVDCHFESISGHVLNLDKEIDDSGIYNVETAIVRGCTFKNIGGSAIKLYRGGRDESTFGPILYMNDVILQNVGLDKRNKNEAALVFHGVQHAEIENIKMENSRKMQLHLLVGEPVIRLKDIKMVDTESLVSNSNAYSAVNINQSKN